MRGLGKGISGKPYPREVQCEEAATRTRDLLVTGGEALPDAAQHSVIIMSSTLSSSPTYAKTSQTLKVNSILYPSPLPPPLDGILLHTPSFDHARCTSTGTGAREEARGLEDDKREAWKRRWKKRLCQDRHYRPLPTGTTGQPVLPLPRPAVVPPMRVCVPYSAHGPCIP